MKMIKRRENNKIKNNNEGKLFFKREKYFIFF